MNGSVNGNGPSRVEWAQSTALLLAMVGIVTCMGVSFFFDPKYDKGVYIGLTACISIVTGILFGKAVQMQPPQSQPPTTTTTTRADPSQVTTTTATPAGTLSMTTQPKKDE